MDTSCIFILVYSLLLLLHVVSGSSGRSGLVVHIFCCGRRGANGISFRVAAGH